MEKKKIAIVAIIIFIFVGLMVFTFANPEEEKPGTTKPGEKTEDVVNPEKQNKDEEIISEEEASESKKSVVDDSYDKALKAVEDAEKLLTREAYDKAVALVAKSSKNKNALNERLEKVDHDLDIQELVNDLNNKLASATSRADILAAISFRDEKSINAELVATVNNAELKGTLETLMTDINKVLDDETAPSINLDKEYYNEDVTVTFEDDNELVITVSKNGEEAVETENGSEFTEEGTYTVTATDKAFNEKTYTFKIDKTKPTMNVANVGVSGEDDPTTVLNHIAGLNKTINFTGFVSEKIDLNSIEFYLVQGENEYKIPSENIGTTNLFGVNMYLGNIKVDANITLADGYVDLVARNVKDLAGNVAEDMSLLKEGVTLLIDRIAPTVINQTQTYNTKGPRIDLVTEFSETVKVMGGNNKVVETTKITTYYYRSKTITVNFEDLAGNENSYTVAIDMTAPIVTVEYSETEPTNQDVVVTITSNEELQGVEGFETEDNLVFTKTFSENTNGAIELTVKDLVGNPTLVTYNVANVDKVKPTITVADTSVGLNNIYNKIDVVLADNAELNFVKINETVKKINLTGLEATLAFDDIKEYLTSGENTIRVKDKAGNQRTLTFNYNSNLVAITNNEELANAITNQADNQYWLIKEGKYTLSKNNTIEYGSQTGWFLPIVKNGIKIEGLGNVSIKVDEMPENGAWASQDMIIIAGDNVEIKNVTLGGFQNKLIEVIGDNAVISDVVANPYNGKEAGSIYIGATGITTTLKNIKLNKGRVTLSGADSTNVINIDNVNIKYSGGEYEANAFLAFNDHSGATVNATKLAVSMSDAFTGDVIGALNMLPNGSTVNFNAGTYNIGSATLNKALTINGNGSTFLGNLTVNAEGTKLIGLNITSEWNNALVINANNVQVKSGKYVTSDVNKQGEGTIRFMASETSNLVVQNVEIVGGLYIDNYTNNMKTLLKSVKGNTITMQYSGDVPMGNIIFHTNKVVTAGDAASLAEANTLNHAATKGYEVLIHNTGGWDILDEVKFGFEE